MPLDLISSVLFLVQCPADSKNHYQLAGEDFFTICNCMVKRAKYTENGGNVQKTYKGKNMKINDEIK